MTIEEKRRELFEAGINIRTRARNEHGDYVLAEVRDRWDGFNAALDAVVIELPESWVLGPNRCARTRMGDDGQVPRRHRIHRPRPEGEDMSQITITLRQIKSANPCEEGWKKVLKANGGIKADIDKTFPLSSILGSNDLADALWTLQCLPEYHSLWRKFAVWCARQVQHLMIDPRSINALDVAWRHSDGLATDEELASARDAAWDAAWDAARDEVRAEVRAAAWAAAWASAWASAWAAARDAARAAARDAARDAAAQQAKLKQILDAGEWVE